MLRASVLRVCVTTGAARAVQTTAAQPGFTIANVQHTVEGAPCGYRLRVSFDAVGLVTLRYARQIAAIHGTELNRPLPATAFGESMLVKLPPAAVTRFIGVFEGAEEAAEFRSKAMTGTLVALPVYDFRLSVKLLNQPGATASPSALDVVLDAGHAVMMHRCLSVALNHALGFTSGADLPVARDTRPPA